MSELGVHDYLYLIYLFVRWCIRRNKLFYIYQTIYRIILSDFIIAADGNYSIIASQLGLPNN
jgi:hypothetical protein